VLGIEENETDDTVELTFTVAIDSYEEPASAVTESDTELYSLEPVALLPRIVNVYAVPAVSPDTVIGLDEPEPVIEPGLESAVNVVAGPPLVAAVYSTVADSAPAVAVPTVGAEGMSTTLPFLGDTLLVAIVMQQLPRVQLFHC
jgi:hypothetical protein